LIFTMKVFEITNLIFTMLKIKVLLSKLTNSLLVVATVLLPLSSLPQDKVIDQVVAVVGSNIILKSEIEEIYISSQAQGRTSTGDMKCEILEELLQEKLLLAEAEIDTTISATPSQINQQTEGMLQQYLSYFQTEKAIEDYFKKPIAVIKSEMQERVKSQILTQQMQQKIIQNVTATPSEVRSYYRSLKDDVIPVIPAQYEYAQITYMPPTDLAEENRVKTQLRDLKKKIEDGSSFSAMAVVYSEGPEAGNGGELPYKGRAEFDETYAAAAFNLKSDKISNVVKTEEGYHIIQLMDRKGEKIKVRDILIKPKISISSLEQASLRLDSIANMIRKNEITFDQAAMLFSYDKNSRNNGGIVINQNTSTSKFPLEELDADVSKVLTKLRLNEISDPFKSIDENQTTVFKIIRLVNKIESHKANLQDDYQQLTQEFLMKKKEKTLNDWFAKQQKDNYIRIDNTYANCNFKFKNWIK
jgi:peptidyl-prolyl cis-trans isomerase SurA